MNNYDEPWTSPKSLRDNSQKYNTWRLTKAKYWRNLRQLIGDDLLISKKGKIRLNFDGLDDDKIYDPEIWDGEDNEEWRRSIMHKKKHVLMMFGLN
ncbi:MAG: hypothetical protein Ta2E_09950 [Mycoplasmoidaceae bacterium]|nr:MAG: hypothetical protein Ta2E_09950 [Mycoplasmoidaceae bacterium]